MLGDLKINLAEVKAKRTNLNPQEMGDSAARAKQWKQWQTNPVFDEVEMGKWSQQESRNSPRCRIPTAAGAGFLATASPPIRTRQLWWFTDC
ncbi:MAG: hypothetical protein HC767_00405 [Akkermansiaceae bacterium]|nr:hypothetical protein [Akkermansiaceae bacterium]